MPEAALHVVLNRHDQDGSASKEHIEQAVGHKIAAQLPNDYQAVQRAIETGRFVDGDIALGKAYADFAGRLAGLSLPQFSGGSRLKSLLRKLS
jgi:Flp pilus assembly CpaE family ATPase